MLVLTNREKSELIFSTLFLFLLLFFVYGLVPSMFIDRIPKEISNKNVINIFIVIVLYACWYFLTKFTTNYFVFDS